MTSTRLEGKIVHVLDGEIFEGVLTVEDGLIRSIEKEKTDEERYILPGFVDSHVHIEGSMLPPSRFAETAVQHGTVSTLSDPHEIANVLGVEGIRFMVDEAEKAPLKFYFGAPSCVPASSHETSGTEISAEDIDDLFKDGYCIFLGEVMDYPAVVDREENVMKKIETAQKHGLKIDGHAPGLGGENLERYISAGVTTDHECSDESEGREKLEKGMKIQIREGSAAKNFEELVDLVQEYPEKCMFCSDDKHIDDLERGHIDRLVKRAVERDIDLMKVLRTACINPVEHYETDVGLLKEGDPADFIVVHDLQDFDVEKTFIDGNLVYDSNGENTRFNDIAPPNKINNFKAKKVETSDLTIQKRGRRAKIMDVQDGELTTDRITKRPKVQNGEVVPDTERDILKIAVLNRYEEEATPSLGLVHNFGLTEGALASSVLHDTHNIVAVGADERSIRIAMNSIIENEGGLCAVSDEKERVLPLPIAGLMTDLPDEEVKERYEELKRMTSSMDCELASPFMTLSFQSQLQIPSLKLSDRGLFDVDKFEFVDLFTD